MTPMKLAVLAATMLPIGAGAALAGEKLSTEEAQKITDALRGLGCFGGEMEREGEGGKKYFEVDNTKCADGTYDIKFDADLKLIEKKKD